jgi:hypothetical protein
MIKIILNFIKDIGRRLISYLPKLSKINNSSNASIITKSPSGQNLTPISQKPSKVITLYDSPFGRKAVKSHSVNGVTVVYKGQQRHYTQNPSNPNTSITVTQEKVNAISIIESKVNSAIAIIDDKSKVLPTSDVYSKPILLPAPSTTNSDKWDDLAKDLNKLLLGYSYVNPNLGESSYLIRAEQLRLQVPQVSLTQIKVDRSVRCMEFKFESEKPVDIIIFVYAALMLVKEESEFNNFGDHKTIMSKAYAESSDYVPEELRLISIHKNVYVQNHLSALGMLDLMFKLGLRPYIGDSYPYESVRMISFDVWNMDIYANRRIRINRITNTVSDMKTGEKIKHSLIFNSNSAFNNQDVINKRGFHTSVSRYTSVSSEIITPTPIITPTEVNTPTEEITPTKKPVKNAIGLLKKSKKIDIFGTGDIETVNINNVQVPISISTCYDGETNYFEVDHSLMLTDSKTAVQNMFNDYFEFIFKQKAKIIFYHNLGRFDGVFIFEALVKYAKAHDTLEEIQTLIDAKKSFLSIKYYYNEEGDSVTFQDSLRLFGV